MLRANIRVFLACCAAGVALAGCGGGGASNSTPSLPKTSTGTTTTTPASAPATYPISSATSTQPLPSAGGITGSMAVPAVPGAPADSAMTVTSSTTAPAGAATATALRQVKSGSLTFFFFTTIQLNETLTLPTVPGISVFLPSSISTANGTFFYAISDPTAPPGQLVFRTEGPAVVNGQQITFNPSPNPLTLKEGVSYVLTFYKITGPPNANYSLVRTIGVPGAVGGAFPFAYDISFVDAAAHRYYLGDRTTAGVDIVDTQTNTFLGTVPGFAGIKLLNPTTTNNNLSGPNGVASIGGGLLAAADGDSTLKIVDPNAKAIVSTVKSGKNPFAGTISPQVIAGCVVPNGVVTSNAYRLDELAYDPADDVIFAINDADCPPYGTFFSGKPPYNVLGTISFGTSFNGVEQPIWDSAVNQFLLANPQTIANPNGEIDYIDPNTFAITRVVPLGAACSPHGLALGPNGNAVIGCSVPNSQILILNVASGAIVGTVAGYGGSDECWYNPGDNRYYCAASNQKPASIMIVIDAGTNRLLTTFPTAVGSHSVAADPATNKVFVPQRGLGITVYNY